MKLIAILLLMTAAFPSWSTVTVGSGDCPVQFEGRVKEIIEPVGTSDFFDANTVVFENQRTLKGEVDDQVLIEVLQNGPFKVAAEKDYKVQLRNGKICWIEEI